MLLVYVLSYIFPQHWCSSGLQLLVIYRDNEPYLQLCILLVAADWNCPNVRGECTHLQSACWFQSLVTMHLNHCWPKSLMTCMVSLGLHELIHPVPVIKVIKSPQYTGGDFMFLYRFVRRRRRRPQILVHTITFEQLFGFLSFLALLLALTCRLPD